MKTLKGGSHNRFLTQIVPQPCRPSAVPSQNSYTNLCSCRTFLGDHLLLLPALEGRRGFGITTHRKTAMAKRWATAASDETTELALSEEPVKTEQHPSTLEEATTKLPAQMLHPVGPLHLSKSQRHHWCEDNEGWLVVLAVKEMLHWQCF